MAVPRRDQQPIPVVIVGNEADGAPADVGQTTMANSLPVVIASDQSNIPVMPQAGNLHLGQVGGQKTYAKALFTRPGDATPYSAFDAIANSTSAPVVLTFANMGRIFNGTGYIIGASVTHEKLAVTPRLRLHLWNAAPTPFNDNVPFALTYALVTNDAYQGFVEFPAMSSEAGTDYSRAQRKDQGKLLEFICSGVSLDLFGLLETLDGFTPGNAKGFTTRLWGEVD